MSDSSATITYNMPELRGRKRIYTDAEYLDESNIPQLMPDFMMIHMQNVSNMLYLIKFDKGYQPLVRKKTVRSDINIESVANIANEITEFKLGYVWGNPVANVQKSDSLPIGSDKKADNTAISQLNDFYYAEHSESKDQELARFVEICGIGYQYIDIKRDYVDGDSPFDLITLNPLFTFCVYSSDIGHRKLAAVTYTERRDMTRFYTVITPHRVYRYDTAWHLVNGKSNGTLDYIEAKRSGEVNPFGCVNVVEFNRSCDRTGCFERQVKELNALNVLASDLCNDVAQNTQAIWWGNDIELGTDEDGNVEGVKGGQWILTRTNGGGQKPDIKSLTLSYDYTGVIENITTTHDYILERAFVPKQSDPGGGSTGTAMSMSSGWLAAEMVACKETTVLKQSFQERNKLALIAIKKSPDISQDLEVLNLTANDIEIRFPRQKTFDMATKVNSLATMLNSMVNPRVAMETVDLFPDLAEAVASSIDNMEKLQTKMLSEDKAEDNVEEKTAEEWLTDTEIPLTTEVNDDRTMQDSSDQNANSPASDI